MLLPAITAFFNFLSTQQGQLMLGDLRKLPGGIVHKIGGLINHLHSSLPAADQVKEPALLGNVPQNQNPIPAVAPLATLGGH